MIHGRETARCTTFHYEMPRGVGGGICMKQNKNLRALCSADLGTKHPGIVVKQYATAGGGGGARDLHRVKTNLLFASLYHREQINVYLELLLARSNQYPRVELHVCPDQFPRVKWLQC